MSKRRATLGLELLIEKEAEQVCLGLVVNLGIQLIDVTIHAVSGENPFLSF